MAQLHPHVISIIEETGERDAVSAIRCKARALVRRYHEYLGEVPPFNLQAFASFCGLHESAEAPRFSADSEIAPQTDGSVALRVNRERPWTRQRFSIGHEIGHTLFPDYQQQVRCRKAHDRDWSDPEDVIESLCDVVASELLFPEPWFHERVAQTKLSAGSISSLALDYQASPDATVRRLVEVHSAPLAVMFVSWKMKPIEIRESAADRHQIKMFMDDDLAERQPKLRVDYAIVNGGFASEFSAYVPPNKSVPLEGAIYDASLTHEVRDGAMWLDLGSCSGHFDVHAIPVYTPDDLIGPNRCISVAAVLNPPRRSAVKSR